MSTFLRLLLVVCLGLVGFGVRPAAAADMCTYTVGVSRSDHGGGTYSTLTVEALRDSRFSFQGCSASGPAGQACVSKYGITAGARLLRDQNGTVVGEGVCCNDVTNAVTSVSASCPPPPPPAAPCTYTIGVSRSDHGGGTYSTLTVKDSRNASFSFQGCSAAGPAGQACVANYGVASGARLLKNDRGATVGEGVCCNNVTNAVTSVSVSCVANDLSLPGARTRAR